MRRWIMRPYSLLLVSALALGCAVDTTEPRTLTLKTQSSVDATSAALPNVVRFRNEFVFLIQDRESDLLAIAGLPDHPKDVIECGGTEELHFAIADIQWVGAWPDVVVALARGADYNLDVYQFSSFAGVCASDPIAHGVGRVRYNENDVFRTSGRTDTYSFWIAGPVSLVGGGTANLLAHSLSQILPDAGGVPRVVVSDVALNGR
jgi:hypothetical protein